MRTELNHAGKKLFLLMTTVALAACGNGGGPGDSSSAQAPVAGTPDATAGAPPATVTPAPPAAGTATPTPAGTPITASGVMTKGSVIVNGIRFEDTRARFRLNDRDAVADELRDGMMVVVRGRLGDDGINGEADAIEVENELRGPASGVDAAAQAFSVGGVRVRVDAATIYANLPALSLAGVGGQYVEVHGARDAADIVHASRIEGQVRGTGEGVDELRGSVSNSSAGVFALGTVVVTHAGGVIPAGTLVEVHGAFTGTNAFAASRVDLEDQENASFRPAENERGEIQGFVTGLDAARRTFNLNGRSVRYTADTQLRGGVAGDLIDDARVEVDGTTSGTVLVAREIRFKQTRVLIDGRLLARSGTASGAITVLGKTIAFDAGTRVDARRSGGGGNATIADIVVGSECVSVRAVETGGQLVAERITEASDCRADEDLVQSRVTGVDRARSTVTLLNDVTASLAGTSVFRNVNGAAMTRDQFFALVNGAGRTVVKVRGTFSNGTLLATEAELQS